MQLLGVQSLSDNPPGEIVLNQDKFDRGVITLIDQSKLPRNALKEAVNIKLAEDGAPMVQDGLGWFGAAASNDEIDGSDMFQAADRSIHLLKVAGGTVYRSLNDGFSWEACTGGTLDPGKDVGFLQGRDFMYIYNGENSILRYDGTSVLVAYVGLSSPSPVSLVKTGLGGTTLTYRYRVSAVNEIGYTQASTVLTIQVNRSRPDFDASNFVTFTWGAVTGAVRYDIFVGQTADEEVFIDSVPAGTVSYMDDGRAAEQITFIAPDTNSTTGPRVADMELVGNRIGATNDKDNPNRVWISGAGRNMGKFASGFDGLYFELPGRNVTHVRPVKVEDYRDGKNDSRITIWCDTADGRGQVWQGHIENLILGENTYPVAVFVKLPGSRGTNAPLSVINVLNDYIYYNSQAFYNLGSRAQFLNLLSTDEISANIRPNVLAIRQSASHKICGHFQDAKLYMSVPYDSDENNATIVHDTSIPGKPFLPRAFNVGFRRIFSYTMANGDKKILAFKKGDNRLTEISPNIRGFYGQPIQSSLITGLRHVNDKNRFEFMWAEEAEVEFAQPRGEIRVELSGITREDGFRLLGKAKILKPKRVKSSWTTKKWTVAKWTDTSNPVVSYSEPSLKRFWSVGEDINAYQYRVQTSSLQAQYILRTLQIHGTPSEGGKPPEWEEYDD